MDTGGSSTMLSIAAFIVTPIYSARRIRASRMVLERICLFPDAGSRA